MTGGAEQPLSRNADVLAYIEEGRCIPEKPIFDPQWCSYYHHRYTCEWFNFDDPVAVKQATAFVDVPHNASTADHIKKRKRRLEDDRRSGLDRFVGRGEASDGDVR